MWRQAFGFDGYWVSDVGDVASVRRGKWHEMTLHIDACGYRRLALYRSGVRVNVRVHVLVAEAFISARPDGLIVRHIDGNHMNNSANNLMWGTSSENARDSVTHMTQRNIKKTHCPLMHAYTEENTTVESGGNRRCRKCKRDRERVRRANARSLS
jgi:hypothetical protein